MAQNLAQLAEALRSGAEAKGQASNLQQQMNVAQNMADTPYGQIDSTGYVSPLAVMANALRRTRGEKQMRELRPQLGAAQAAQAEAQNANTMYGLQQALDKQTYDRSRNAAQDLIAADERKWERGADARALKLAQDKYGIKSGEREVKEFQNKQSGEH